MDKKSNRQRYVFRLIQVLWIVAKSSQERKKALNKKLK